MGTIIIINVELSIGEYCLVHLALYLLIQLVIFTISALVNRFRKGHKRITDTKSNIALSLMVSSIITGILIPLITYITQFNYWFNAHCCYPDWTTQDESRITLFTILLPFMFYVIISFLSNYWYRNRKKILKKEFRQSRIDDEAKITENS